MALSEKTDKKCKSEDKKPEFYCAVQKIEPERSLGLERWSGWKARKSASRLSAEPTEILGTKLKLSRQRALGLELGRILGRINLAIAGGLIFTHYLNVKR